LPEEIKRKLLEYEDKIEELFTPYRTEGSGSGPIRWTKPENLHITLAFLGYLSDEELVEVLRITKEVASRHQPFSINLNKICYGPPKMPYSETKSLTGRRDKIANRPPRMIWVEGEKSKDLANLQIDLEKSLTSSGKIRFEPEERSFTCHITLGRIRQWEFRQIEPEERPNVDEDISSNFEVKSIEVMESQLKRGGAEYTILESIPLSK
jgi:2'-5' RNA ligase